jgi:hypothetical protein
MWRFCEFTVVSGNKLMTLLSLTVSVDLVLGL